MRNDVRMRFVATLLLLSLFGCSKDATPAFPHDRIRLLARDLSNLGVNGPELRRSVIAVSRYGHVAFTGGFTEGPELVTIVDSTGTVVSRFGVEGGGPDELRGVYYLFFRDSTVFAADVFEGRLVEYALDGSHLGTLPLGNLLIPVGHVPDSIDLADYSQSDLPQIVRVGLNDSSGSRILIPRGDSLFGAFIDRARASRGLNRQGIGSTLDGVVLGEGVTYTLFEYSNGEFHRFGEQLEPQFARGSGGVVDTLSYFGLYGFELDEVGRLWVAGQNDSAGFVDIYENRRLTARFNIDCLVNPRYGMSIAGRWLALLCEEPEDADAEVTLRLYEFEG